MKEYVIIPERLMIIILVITYFTDSFDYECFYFNLFM